MSKHSYSDKFYKITLRSDQNINGPDEYENLVFALNLQNVDDFKNRNCLLIVDELLIRTYQGGDDLILYYEGGQPFSYDTKTKRQSQELIYLKDTPLDYFYYKENAMSGGIITMFPENQIRLRLSKLDGSRIQDNEIANGFFITLKFFPLVSEN